ncbi:MAG TPA: glycosyltransferase, partial [Acidimicrobiales bacterium]
MTSTRPADPGAPTVSVVVVTWNCRDAVLRCIASLQAGATSLPWELIVVDNASGDGTVEAVRGAAPEARVIANRTNRGLAAANNQGMLAGRGEMFLISNPDVI